MKKLYGICLILTVLFLADPIQAAQDTLRPADDAGTDLTGGDDWTAEPANGKYATIDEITLDNGDYIVTNGAGADQIWDLPEGSGSGTIDSVYFYVQAWYTGSGAKITPHRWYWYAPEDFWYVCEGTIDTLVLTGLSALYVTRFGANDPCTESAWQWPDIYLNDDYCWGVENLLADKVGDTRVSWSWVVVFSTEEAAGNPRRNIIIKGQNQ